jgi:hypothetical protein
MQAGSAVDDFVGKISKAIEGAGRRGIHLTAGAGSCDLETQQFGGLPEEEEPFPTGRPHHLESPVGSRDLGGHEGISRLCYFLDGVQSSRDVGMRERARGRVRSLRERLEGGLLRRWEGDDRVLGDSEAWIAVDGQLKDIRESNRRAVGLIKSVARPEFVGKDIGMLLDLGPGMRTTSFIPDWQLRRDQSERRTSWYLRMWPPQPGADALGSLMRVEAPRDTEPEQVDEISRWILAERAPLAKPDPRWPAMIYPIQYVEKILKPLVQGPERAYARLERQLASNGRN